MPPCYHFDFSFNRCKHTGKACNVKGHQEYCTFYAPKIQILDLLDAQKHISDLEERVKMLEKRLEPTNTFSPCRST